MVETKVEVNCTTGEVTEVELSTEEVTRRADFAAQSQAARDLAESQRPVFNGEASTADQIKAGVASLRTYLDNPNPTAVQSTAALKLLIRGFFFLLRRVF